MLILRSLLTWLVAVAGLHASEPLITFCAMGDVPYLPFEDELVPRQIADLPADLPFAIHVGDIKSGTTPCVQEVYEKVSGMLAKSKVPIFIIPGDNEWNDCADPAAAWELWVKHFDRFEERWELPFKVERQDDPAPSFAFVHEQVLFIGLCVVGGRVHSPDEWMKRHAASLTFVKSQFAKHGSEVKAAVVFGHAKPAKSQADFFTPFSEAAGAFEKPVLYLHGDGHVWLHDHPFESQNILRVQVDQGRLGPPVMVSVSEDAVSPFQFDRQRHTQPIIRQYPADGLTMGPEKGSLVIDGGSGGVDGANNFKRFVELAGGEEAKIVVVPTARADAEKYKLDGLRKSFIERKGMIKPASLTILHTTDPKEADTEEFVAPIREATGIWFGGGRQWRIVDAYGDTLAEREFRAVLERGGAIGGSSAGATIQGSFLARGDSTGNTIMLGDHQRGFAYLKNAAIDQHVVARGRQLDMLEILTDPKTQMVEGHDRKALIGLGIDEGSAMVVQGNVFEVIGKPTGGVLVYDPSTWVAGLPPKHKFLTLGPGSKYDLKTRTALKVVAPELPPPPKPVPAKP
ncbi:MAG: cyanophycinase [Verrucomicrobiales bacterium]|jgi:cyanophycinase